MYQPQIIELDPMKIKFNKFNPRKHGGEEYERLKQSIQEMGIIQPPLVRHTTGIFYEAIDGEGRVSVAQELKLPTIKVVNLGDITEDEALERLVVSNVVRQFDFFARCKGMAALHRKGKTAEKISKELGMSYPGMVIRDMGIGYFPEEILSCILTSIQENEDKARVWSHHLLYELLPLREVLPGKDDPRHSGIIEGAYDYSEVQRAVEKVIKGDISNGVEMKAYVEQRRRELGEQRFNQELQARLKEEIKRTEKALEEAKTLDISKATETVKRTYQAQLAALEAQLIDARRERDTARQATVASERDKKAIKALQEALDVAKDATRKAKESARDEARKEAERERQELQKQFDAEVKARKEALAKEEREARERYEQHKKDLEIYYKDQAERNRLKAELSYRQLVASTSEHLSQSRQSALHIISRGMIQGMEWLSQEELVELLSNIQAVRSVLSEAERVIEQRMGVVRSSETVIDSEQDNTRSLVNHHG